jgi:hypothetical protein
VSTNNANSGESRQIIPRIGGHNARSLDPNITRYWSVTPRRIRNSLTIPCEPLNMNFHIEAPTTRGSTQGIRTIALATLTYGIFSWSSHPSRNPITIATRLPTVTQRNVFQSTSWIVASPQISA